VEGKPVPGEKNNLDETIETSFEQIQVKQECDNQRRETRCPNCWVETGAGIQRDTEGDRQISGEPEAAGCKHFNANTAISTGIYKIPCLRWSTLPEVEYQ
jgi:hypothetical protein